MHKYIKTPLSVIIVIISLSSCRPTEICSSVELERKELLNRIQKMERIYVWYNIKTAFKYPALISVDLFERLPIEWIELKRLIRKGQLDEAYLIVKNKSVDISWALRYTLVRMGFYEIAHSFHSYFEEPEDAGLSNSNLSREQWFMWEYPLMEYQWI